MRRRHGRTAGYSVAWQDSLVDQARRWISGLDAELAIQARLLTGLLDATGRDDRWDWLAVGCSVAAGRGDSLSDLDLGLGYADDQAPPAGEVTAMLRSLGQVVDLSVRPWDGIPRWWVQYGDGGQIDLVVMPADRRRGRAPGEVALLDRSGRLRDTFTPDVWRADSRDPHDWLMDGWEALGNVAKYLRRSSLLEALDQVHRARNRVLQLWAVGEGASYPAFGLTSLLDDETPTLPPGIEASYATPRPEAVRAAALATAELLHLAGRHADAELDTPLRGYVTARLAAG